MEGPSAGIAWDFFANEETRGISWYRECTPVWRNWQTQQTQNLPGITPREGSIPFTGTKTTSFLRLVSTAMQPIG
jgi:hypothetical protein